MDLTNVNSLAELEVVGVPWVPVSETEIKVKCPFHQDSEPSCCLNIKKNLFNCPACGKTGNVVHLLAGLTKLPAAQIIVDLATRYDLGQNEKSIEISIVEEYHKAIWTHPVLLAELYKRGVTDHLIRKHRFGVFDGRITIPIFSASGNVVSLRKYLPGAPSSKKMLNTKGFGTPKPYPIEQFKYDKLMLCGGECKAIVAANQLNPHGIGAGCITKGEQILDEGELALFKGKTVYVCMDVDSAGVKASKGIALQLLPNAKEVYLVDLPLDREKHPKGDINDFVMEGGSLLTVIQTAKLVKFEDLVTPGRVVSEDETPVPVQLFDAYTAQHTGTRVTTTGVITAMDTSPYTIPKDLHVRCDKNQPKACAICPVFNTGVAKYNIPSESEFLLEFINSAIQDKTLKDACGVPSQCRGCHIDVDAYYGVEEVRLGPELDLTKRTTERRHFPGYIIGTGATLNTTYALTGRMWPHPKNSQAVFLASQHKPIESALEGFKLEDPTRLSIFQAGGSLQELKERLEAIYSDLEANVTRIFERRAIHLAVDMAYHSVLNIFIDGKMTKGWTEVLVLGDSSQGKTETSQNLQEHYRLGDKVDCKNASVAGLLGGLEQSGTGRWFVSWGAIPTADQQLVILEELKGASQDVLGKLTEMRSSGIASIQKIQSNRAPARTRWLALSNPRSDLPMGKYACGVEAVRELMGAPEDVRRFDHVAIVASGDIPAEKIQQLQSSRPVVEHRYTSDLCNQLVLWAWTRKADQVHFTPEAEKQILQSAARLCGIYHESIPLVDRGSMRHKLARLSAAIAARVFSCSEDYEHLIVHDYHVQFVADHLDQVYSSPNFGYRLYSEAMNALTTVRDPEDVVQELKRAPYARDLIQGLKAKVMVDVNDICDLSGLDFGESRALIGALVRKGCLVRNGRQGSNYTKSIAFIELLKNIDVAAIAVPPTNPLVETM